MNEVREFILFAGGAGSGWFVTSPNPHVAKAEAKNFLKQLGFSFAGHKRGEDRWKLDARDAQVNIIKKEGGKKEIQVFRNGDLRFAAPNWNQDVMRRIATVAGQPFQKPLAQKKVEIGKREVVAPPKVDINPVDTSAVTPKEINDLPLKRTGPYAREEQNLELMPVVKTTKLGFSASAPYKVQLADGTEAIYKDDAKEPCGGGWGVLCGYQAAKEAGAWEVAKAVGLDTSLSPTVPRKVGNTSGVIQRWIPGTATGGQIGGFFGLPDTTVAKLAAFDYVIGNRDRHDANWLVKDDHSSPILIDHGFSFPDSNKNISSVFGGFVGRARILELPVDAKPYVDHKDDIAAALTKVKMPQANIDATMTRIEKLSQTQVFDRDKLRFDIQNTKQEKPMIDRSVLASVLLKTVKDMMAGGPGSGRHPNAFHTTSLKNALLIAKQGLKLSTKTRQHDSGYRSESGKVYLNRHLRDAHTWAPEVGFDARKVDGKKVSVQRRAKVYAVIHVNLPKSYQKEPDSNFGRTGKGSLNTFMVSKAIPASNITDITVHEGLYSDQLGKYTPKEFIAAVKSGELDPNNTRVTQESQDARIREHDAMPQSKEELARQARMAKQTASDKAWYKKHGKEYDINSEEQPMKDQKKEWPLQDKYTYQGLNISIENKKGSTRSGKEPSGKPWSIKMPFDYGYIASTKGKDGDEVDCFIGPDKKAKYVFIVHQRTNNGPECSEGAAHHIYDEDKCFLGWDSADAAKKAYHSAYKNVDLFTSMTMMSIKEFKQKLEDFRGKKLHAALQAGGPGSGRHKEVYDWIMSHKAWDSAKPKIAEAFAKYYVKNHPDNVKPLLHAWMEYNGWSSKPVPKGKHFGAMRAGGPGSGRHPYGKKAKPSKALAKLQNRVKTFQKHRTGNAEYLHKLYQKQQVENKALGRNARGREILSTKQHIAVKNAVPGTKALQDVAETGELLVAKALAKMGGVQSRDNSPMDVTFHLPNGKTAGLEVKSMVVQKQDRIYSKGKALQRKTQWGKDNNASVGIVALDFRNNTKNPDVYYRAGLGSFMVSTMTPVQGGLKGLAKAIGGK